MLILVCEDFRSPIDSMVDKVKATFPPSSILFMNRDNSEEVFQVLKNKPMLTDRWLVVINIKNPQESFLKQLVREDLVSLLVFRNKDDMTAVSNRLSVLSLKHNVVDNSKVSKDAMHEYVMRILSVDLSLAKYVCARHQYYVPKVMESVEFMEITGIRDKNKIRKYIERTGDISYNAVFDYVIGVGDTTLKRVVTLVHRYKSGHKHLLDFLIERMGIYLFVYEQSIRGKLSFENVRDFYEANKDRLEKVPEYVLVKALDSMAHVSYDKLYFLSLLYQKERSNTSLSSFIYLLKMSQEGR